MARPYPKGSLPQLHMGMMPGKRSKWNPDQSRAPGTGVHDSAVGGRDDRAALRDFADTGDWPNGAGGGEPAGGRQRCNSAARGHSGNTTRTLPGIRRHDRTVAVEPLRHAPPCVFAGGAGQRQRLRGKVKTSLCGDLTKVAVTEPRRSNGGVPVRIPAFEVTLAEFDCWRMIGRMIRAFGADDVALPKHAQKTTFSDDC